MPHWLYQPGNVLCIALRIDVVVVIDTPIAIDYCAYIHQINTVKEPKGMFLAELDEGQEIYVEVPVNDYRSIKKSILNLEEFYAANKPLRL